jgi:hypothetical protein
MSEGMSLRYEFEEENRRDANSEKGKAYARRFLKRLKGAAMLPEPGDSDVAAVLEFVEQVHLNIEWYTNAARRQYRLKLAVDILLLFVGLGTAVLTVLAGVIEKNSAAGAVGVVLAVATAVLKLIPESHDFQKYRKNFWQASADLKTQLYSLESEAVKGSVKVYETPGSYALTSDFRVRLDDELKKARQVCKKQQEEFYDLLAEPAALLTKTEALRNAVERAPRDAARPWVKRRLFEIEQRRVVTAPRIAVLDAIPEATRTEAQKQELVTLNAEEAGLQTEKQRLEELIK